MLLVHTYYNLPWILWRLFPLSLPWQPSQAASRLGQTPFWPASMLFWLASMPFWLAKRILAGDSAILAGQDHILACRDVILDGQYTIL